MNDQIYLIGFMGSGKSTVAQCLHENYGLEVMEMDRQIAEAEGMSIPDIFSKKGEAYFRTLETRLLKELSSRRRIVVSCGGGTAMRECNVREMKKRGLVVLLSASPQTIFERVRTSDARPLLQGNMNRKYIEKLMWERGPGYRAAADMVVETDRRPAEEICRELLERAEARARSEQR